MALTLIGLAALGYRDFFTPRLSSENPAAKHVAKPAASREYPRTGWESLFGRSDGIAMPNTAKPPPSTLSLTLTATFTQADPAKSIAIIASQDKTTRQFVAGDEVAPGTTLARVAQGFVVLLRNGREEMLMLPILADNQSPQNQPDFHRAPSITAPAPSQSAASESRQDQNDEALRKQKLMERLKALRDQRAAP